MTREEALSVLQDKSHFDTSVYGYEAIDMAIEALQAEPVVRCIDCVFWYDCEYTFKSENGFCCCGEREEE